MKHLVRKYLRELGPCLSSKIVDRLVAENHISREYARKIISRTIVSGEISSLSKIFPKSENFIYLREIYGSDTFWLKLISDLINSGSALGLAIIAVKARGGIMPLAHFGAASGSPVAMKKKLPSFVVLDKLITIGLFTKVELPGIGNCVAIKPKDECRFDIVARSVKARLITESVFISAIIQWARNLNLVSYDSVRARENNESEPPRVSNFLFDITAPSYLSPLVHYNPLGNNKPGFFACDVLLGVKVSLTEVLPFIHKCRSIISLKNVGRCLFVLAASDFTKEAFIELKKNGIIPATPDNLFGKEIGRSLMDLKDFLIYHSIENANGINKIDNLMTKLTEINGVASQLQGALFEYLVAEVVRNDGGHIKIGRICKHNGKKAESDICIDKGFKGITFIECKGYKAYSTVLHEDVQHWVGTQLPIFREQARNDYSTINAEDIRIEFWTTGKLSDESIKSITKTIENNEIKKRCTIVLLEAHQVKDMFNKSKNKGLIAVYEKHFASNFTPTKREEFRESNLLANEPDSYFDDISNPDKPF